VVRGYLVESNRSLYSCPSPRPAAASFKQGWHSRQGPPSPAGRSGTPGPWNWCPGAESNHRRGIFSPREGVAKAARIGQKSPFRWSAASLMHQNGPRSACRSRAILNCAGVLAVTGRAARHSTR